MQTKKETELHTEMGTEAGRRRNREITVVEQLEFQNSSE